MPNFTKIAVILKIPQHRTFLRFWLNIPAIHRPTLEKSGAVCPPSYVGPAMALIVFSKNWYNAGEQVKNFKCDAGWLGINFQYLRNLPIWLSELVLGILPKNYYSAIWNDVFLFPLIKNNTKTLRFLCNEIEIPSHIYWHFFWTISFLKASSWCITINFEFWHVDFVTVLLIYFCCKPVL